MRLTIDARLVNYMLVTPPSVTLMTAEGFFMVEIELEADLDPHCEAGREALQALEPTLGIGDVADAFRLFKINKLFSQYFWSYGRYGKGVAHRRPGHWMGPSRGL